MKSEHKKRLVKMYYKKFCRRINFPNSPQKR